MKTMLKVLAIAAITLFAFSIDANGQDNKKKNEQQVTFSVEIDCPNCQKKLESVLPHEKGVKDLKVSLEKQTVWFQFDAAKTDKEKLKKAIEKQGYTAKEVETAGK